jgi:hypothetical protein
MRRDGFLSKTKKAQIIVSNKMRFVVAEEEGFEPPVPLGTAVFKTAAINRSAIPPVDFFKSGAKLRAFGKKRNLGSKKFPILLNFLGRGVACHLFKLSK